MEWPDGPRSPAEKTGEAGSGRFRIAPCAAGLCLALFTVSLLLLTVIVLFGEGGNASGAVIGCRAAAVLSVLAYAGCELAFSRRYPRESVLALSYFASLAVLLILFAAIVGRADLSFAFDAEPEAARALLLSGALAVGAVHAAALVVRLGIEIVRYARRLTG